MDNHNNEAEAPEPTADAGESLSGHCELSPDNYHHASAVATDELVERRVCVYCEYGTHY